MPSAAAIIERVREHGANIMLDGSKLIIVNRQKLPAGAAEFIRANAKEIATFLDREGEFEERAAIIEHEGGLTKAVAEGMARIMLKSQPAGADPADWSWFVGEAAKAMDASLRRAVA